MSTPGLSLVGFLADQALAIKHLREHCLPDPITKTDQELLADWNSAKAKLGQPIQNAGLPDIQDLPNDAQPHLLQLVQAHWYLELANLFPGGLQFKMVEIDKLLAYQFVIDTDRTDHHCKTLTTPPTLEEMLRVCLPIQPPPEKLTVQVTPDFTQPAYFNFPHAAVITTKGRNLRMIAQGVYNDPLNNPNAAGLRFGFGAPGAQVVRLNGRCYLHNGFHRALGLRKSGATHMPCILRDIATEAELGLVPALTFDAALLAGQNPPALEHFTQGRALDVKVRAQRTIIQVSWALHVIAEE